MNQRLHPEILGDWDWYQEKMQRARLQAMELSSAFSFARYFQHADGFLATTAGFLGPMREHVQIPLISDFLDILHPTDPISASDFAQKLIDFCELIFKHYRNRDIEIGSKGDWIEDVLYDIFVSLPRIVTIEITTSTNIGAEGVPDQVRTSGVSGDLWQLLDLEGRENCRLVTARIDHIDEQGPILSSQDMDTNLASDRAGALRSVIKRSRLPGLPPDPSEVDIWVSYNWDQSLDSEPRLPPSGKFTYYPLLALTVEHGSELYFTPCGHTTTDGHKWNPVSVIDLRLELQSIDHKTPFPHIRLLQKQQLKHRLWLRLGLNYGPSLLFLYRRRPGNFEFTNMLSRVLPDRSVPLLRHPPRDLSVFDRAISLANSTAPSSQVAAIVSAIASGPYGRERAVQTLFASRSYERCIR